MKLKISKTESKSNSDQRLSDKMIDRLVDQIHHELYNHNLYRTFANFFLVEGLMKLYEYYTARANEEFIHHQWIVDYLNANHIEFKYPAIPEVSESFDDYLIPFELTLEKEIETTNLINEMVDLALNDKDWLTFNWLMSDSGAKLVAEQREEESISRTVLNIVNQDDSWISKETAILEAYKSENNI